MLHVNYKLSIAGWSVDSSADARTELLELETFAALDSPAGTCRVVVYASPKPKPSLLEEAAGAALSAVGLGGNGVGGSKKFSVEIRGQKVTYGDKLSLALTAGDKSATVVTAEVRSIRSSFGETIITASSGARRLVNTRLNQVYQNQTLKQIASDIASQAGADTGDLDDGSTYPYFVVQEDRNAWAHVRDMARRDGLDLWFDDQNRLTIKKFQKITADHTLYYGIDILNLELLNVDAPSEHVSIYGESASSSTGSDTWYWLAKSSSSFIGDVGKGAKLLTISDAAVRTKDATALFAASKFGAIQDSSTMGRLRLLGNPTIKLAESIEIKNAPKPELNGVFKITSVRHVCNKREGFTTTVEFSGKGGADQAGGVLGQLAGAIGGAIGAL
jgi:phage protein D